jgi:hypothetical protein
MIYAHKKPLPLKLPFYRSLEVHPIKKGRKRILVNVLIQSTQKELSPF